MQTENNPAEERAEPSRPKILFPDRQKLSGGVPLDGSLGLLALGYVGLMTWRDARHQARDQQVRHYQSAIRSKYPPHA